jgi:hypothetical protein
VFEEEPKVQGPWCNPRQLCAVDRYIQTAWQIALAMAASSCQLVGHQHLQVRQQRASNSQRV